MPSLEEHMLQDFEIGLSRSYREVHVLLDQFAHYPDPKFLSGHRKFLHHAEGIEYVALRYGPEAGKAASQHVLDDCGHIPRAKDYYTGSVDNFGFQILDRLSKWREMP